MNPVSFIRPLSDEQAARLASPATLADLAARITETEACAPAGAALRPSRAAAAGRAGWPGRSPEPGAIGPRGYGRRRRLAVVTAVAGIAAALLVAAVVIRPGQRVGPLNVGPASAQALSFTKQGGYLVVIVRNPVADVRTYNAELAAHGIHVHLHLVPGSPSVVGTVVQFTVSGNIKIITARRECTSGYGHDICPVGFKVPLDFHGGGYVYFARAARPGERYAVSGSPFAAGEALSGLRPAEIRGQRVAAVLALLRRRDVTVARVMAEYRCSRFSGNGKLMRGGRVPGDWYVYDAAGTAPGEVALGVGPTRAYTVLHRGAGVWRAECGHAPVPQSGAASPSPGVSPAG